MTVSYNYWHFVILGIITIIFIGGIISAFKQDNKKLVFPNWFNFELRFVLFCSKHFFLINVNTLYYGFNNLIFNTSIFPSSIGT